MTSQLDITVPHNHAYEATCPHCLEDLGDHLAGVYPASDPGATGGERRCPACLGPIVVSVFFPPPVFGIATPPEFDDNVRHFRRPR